MKLCPLFNAKIIFYLLNCQFLQLKWIQLWLALTWNSSLMMQLPVLPRPLIRYATSVVLLRMEIPLQLLCLMRQPEKMPRLTSQRTKRKKWPQRSPLCSLYCAFCSCYVKITTMIFRLTIIFKIIKFISLYIQFLSDGIVFRND